MRIRKIVINKINLLLIAIILIASFFRLYNIGSIPPSPSVDEVSTGYNAYSILKTGRDEYGIRLPLILRSYDDWQPAIYAYLCIPFIYIIGLNVISVRLPAVILSIVTVLITFLLVRELFNSNEDQNIKKLTSADIIALLAALFLAISPWHIYLSRLGFPANAALSFGIFGMYFWFKEKIFFSSFFLTLAFISYHTQKIFIPIIFITLVILFFRKLSKNKIELFFSLLFITIVVSIFIQQSITPNALIRVNATNIFSSYKSEYNQQALLNLKAVNSNDLIGKIIYNRRMLSLKLVSEAYISHYDPRWLFSYNINTQHKIDNIGLIHPWILPFILIGLVMLIISQIYIKTKIFLFIWFLISPLASAFTIGTPHAVRASVFLPLWQILGAYGLYLTFKYLKKINLHKYFAILLLIVIIVSQIYLFHQYFIEFPLTNSEDFQYSLSRAMVYVIRNQNKYNHIIIDNRDALYQSYMYYLFYSRYDPYRYQKFGGTHSGGFAETHKIDKIEFRPIDWVKEKKYTKILYVGTTEDFPQNVNIISIFRSLDGIKSIKIIKVI
jgi:4-amino-4-deoxy-L-arabinose transferase-like glycosyltransferase